MRVEGSNRRTSRAFRTLWADVTEVAVPTFDVVEVVDVICYGGGQLDGGRRSADVEQLDLHPRPERLHGSVIEAVAHGAERAEQAPPPHVLPEAPGGELRTVIGVQNRWANSFSVVDGHVDRVVDQCGIGGGGEGAGDN